MKFFYVGSYRARVIVHRGLGTLPLIRASVRASDGFVMCASRVVPHLHSIRLHFRKPMAFSQLQRRGHSRVFILSVFYTSYLHKVILSAHYKHACTCNDNTSYVKNELVRDEHTPDL